ncbi:prepilin peptidase [Peptacetobacter hiranonis]|uniref:prepilin peptidase n=1 Tax=Peptacetobacter hiranonis TaxID=89152 RepID=UPI0022E33629|nr:prepilin peptidase [Peptacetobacter hiranonis]
MDLEKFKILFLSFSFAIIISLIVQKVVKVFIEEEDYKKININRLTRFLIISTFLYAISIFKIYDDNLYIINCFIFYIFASIISLIDYYTMYVYDILVFSGIIIQSVVKIVNGNVEILVDSVLAGLLCALISYFIVKVTNMMGAGDVGVYALCAMSIGFKSSLSLIPGSFLISSIFLMIRFICGNRDKKIAFAPYIIITAILNILGFSVVDTYFGIIEKII